MKGLTPLVLVWIGACWGAGSKGSARSDLPGVGGDPGGFGGAAEGARPYVTKAVPPLDATGVYPAPLWNGNGEEVVVELSFSSPMRPRPDFGLAARDHVRPMEATWSADATMLKLVVRPDFAFPHPLADATEYSLDVSGLLSDEGAPLEPERALRDGRLVFRTGRHDALLNHSCGHTFFGPFASVGSATSANAMPPDISMTHTQYSVALNDDESGYSGWVRAKFGTSGQYRLYFDGLVTLVIGANDSGGAQALEPATTPRACPGISHETTIDAVAGAELLLRLEASADRIRRVIVELVPDGSAASP